MAKETFRFVIWVLLFMAIVVYGRSSINAVENGSRQLIVEAIEEEP